MTPEQIAHDIAADVQLYCADSDGTPSIEGADENRKWLRDAIATALREARNQALEEVVSGIEAIGEPSDPSDLGKGYYKGWQSAGQFVRLLMHTDKLSALKHKDGQP